MKKHYIWKWTRLKSLLLTEFCMSTLFDWSRAWGFTTSISVGGFMESLRCIDTLYL